MGPAAGLKKYLPKSGKRRIVMYIEQGIVGFFAHSQGERFRNPTCILQGGTASRRLYFTLPRKRERRQENDYGPMLDIKF